MTTELEIRARAMISSLPQLEGYKDLENELVEVACRQPQWLYLRLSELRMMGKKGAISLVAALYGEPFSHAHRNIDVAWINSIVSDLSEKQTD